jgi:hypothetical protein
VNVLNLQFEMYNLKYLSHMTPKELEAILKKYAYRVVTLTGALPNTVVAKIIKGQSIRSAFSAAANFRSACTGYTKRLLPRGLPLPMRK